MMPRGAADLLEVIVFAARAHALLGSRGARVIPLLAAQENVLELVHARVREEQRRVIRGDERRGRQDAVGAFFEESQESASYFIGFHVWVPEHSL